MRILLIVALSLPFQAMAWEDDKVLAFISRTNPIILAQRNVTHAYAQPDSLTWALQNTSLSGRLGLGGTDFRDDPYTAYGGLHINIPLSSVKEEREEALKRVDEAKALDDMHTKAMFDKELDLPAEFHDTPPEEIVKKYVAVKGVLIESPDLYISHVVKQSGGVPQAIHDMLDESGKERIINKRKVREMRHEAGVKYLDFTPLVMVLGAAIVSMRYIGMGTGDKTLYIMGGMGAALFLTFRFFIFKGVGR